MWAHLLFSVVAPLPDPTLYPDDAVGILEEILPAQNSSFELGLKLRLPYYVVEGIHLTHSNPQSRLLRVILSFLKVEPRPTWKVIVDALRSPAVNLPRLANAVEAKHFPDPTSTRDVVTNTTFTGIIRSMEHIMSCGWGVNCTSYIACAMQRRYENNVRHHQR